MLELKNINYSADGKEIIKDLSLKIEDNRLIVITGPNGGGKSTLAKIIMGILTPQSGEIFLNGENITNLSITERAKMGISFAFQQPVKFKGITVYDLISLASGEIISTGKACDYLSEVGLCAKDYINREVTGSLSGGELKRIEIAMALARNTKVTVFDEPEAGIDLWSFKNLVGVFNKMHDDIKSSIIIISHQERILDIADEIVVIDKGRIVSRGEKEKIMPSILNTVEGCKYM